MSFFLSINDTCESVRYQRKRVVGTGLQKYVDSALGRVDVSDACASERTALQKQASSRVYRFYDRVSRR